MGRIQRALISVSDKQGIVEFSRALSELDIEIISTGGTASLLRDNKIPVRDVAEITGFPEMMDGRVKRSTRKCTAASSRSETTPNMSPR